MKNLKYLLFGILAAFVVTTNVNAATTVGNEQELLDALAAGETEISLSADITGVTSNIIVEGEGKNITIDGNGFTVKGSAAKMFEIHAVDGSDEGTDVSVLTVTFKNTTIETSKANGRAIDTRTSDIKLVLDKTTLKTTSTGNNQALTIGGDNKNNITVELNNTTIEAGKAGYGIIAFNPTTFTIKDSTIVGYAVLYMKAGSEGSKFNITDSVLEGKNEHGGVSDNFGTIAFETDNIELNVIDSTIKASGSGSAAQLIFSGNVNPTTGKDNKITVTGGEFVVKPEGYVSTNDTLDITIGAGVNSNIDIPEEYLAENVKVVENADGSVSVIEKHKVVISEVTNGKVVVDKTTAYEGEEVKVTVTPNEGYKVKSVTVNGEEAKNNKFTMPNKDAEVKVEFEKVVVITTPETDTPVSNVDTNPKTGDGILSHGILGLIALLGLSYTLKQKRTN